MSKMLSREPKAKVAAIKPKVKPTASKPEAPAVTAVGNTVTCPHCHKYFDASVDMRQPPRLQGAKCPNCKLFVPARVVVAAGAADVVAPKPSRP